MAIGFIIDLARGISRSVGEYRSGREAEPRTGRQLKGSTLGIIGYGAISEALAPIAVALGMQVLVSDPYKRVDGPGLRQVSMDELLGASDFVCCLALATAETENLMDRAAFGRMRRGAYFLNLSRGNLVDEDALAQALESGQLAGAALDVGRAPDQKPTLRLASRPDVIATPHVAGLTPDAIEHQAFDTVEQVRALLSGKMPPGAVNEATAHRVLRFRG
jgi:D-3-phosphoglycerate dehydrogenase